MLSVAIVRLLLLKKTDGQCISSGWESTRPARAVCFGPLTILQHLMGNSDGGDAQAFHGQPALPVATGDEACPAAQVSRYFFGRPLFDVPLLDTGPQLAKLDGERQHHLGILARSADAGKQTGRLAQGQHRLVVEWRSRDLGFE